MEYTEITYTWEDNSLQQNEDQREMMHECMWFLCVNTKSEQSMNDNLPRALQVKIQLRPSQNLHPKLQNKGSFALLLHIQVRD